MLAKSWTNKNRIKMCMWAVIYLYVRVSIFQFYFGTVPMVWYFVFGLWNCSEGVICFVFHFIIIRIYKTIIIDSFSNDTRWYVNYIDIKSFMIYEFDIQLCCEFLFIQCLMNFKCQAMFAHGHYIYDVGVKMK